MLRPLYTNRATHLLLIGPPASGKRCLAKQLLLSEELYFSVKILENVDSTTFQEAIKADYVMVLVDMTNSTSLTLLGQTMAHMAPNYILYKCSIVFTKVDLIHLWMLNEDQVRATIKQYGDPRTFHVNLNSELMRKKVSNQMIKAVCVSTSQQRHVHPLEPLFLDQCQINED